MQPVGRLACAKKLPTVQILSNRSPQKIPQVQTLRTIVAVTNLRALTGVPFHPFLCGKSLTTGFVEVESKNANAFFKCLVRFKVSPKPSLPSTFNPSEPIPEPLIKCSKDSSASNNTDSVAVAEVPEA